MRCSSLPVALYSLQALLQVVQVGRRRGWAGVCVCRGVGVRVVLLLVQLSGLFELRQLAVEHVGGGGHRRLRGQQWGDGRSLLSLVLASSDTLLQVERCVNLCVHTVNITQECCRSNTNTWKLMRLKVDSVPAEKHNFGLHLFNNSFVLLASELLYMIILFTSNVSKCNNSYCIYYYYLVVFFYWKQKFKTFT